MNTLSQLEQQAKEMQAKLDEMKATIEAQRKAEEDKQNLKSPFGIGSGEFYYVLSRCFDKGFEVKGRYDLSCFKADTKYIFNSQESAENWADAFRVILELRSCEGVEVPVYHKKQFYVSVNKEAHAVYVDHYYTDSGCISPFFSTEEYAEKAILTVGKERIIKAFQTLMGTQQ